MLDSNDIFETLNMIREDRLDIRTVTMGISLLDCQSDNIDRLCSRIYDKLMRCAGELVPTGEAISKEYGIPIINKRVSVTPVALLSGITDCDGAVKLALTLDRAARELGISRTELYNRLREFSLS